MPLILTNFKAPYFFNGCTTLKFHIIEHSQNGHTHFQMHSQMRVQLEHVRIWSRAFRNDQVIIVVIPHGIYQGTIWTFVNSIKKNLKLPSTILMCKAHAHVHLLLLLRITMHKRLLTNVKAHFFSTSSHHVWYLL